MTNEELILERLDQIESRLEPITGSINSIRELRQDLNPISSNAIQLMVKELQDVESAFQLDDLLDLAKRFLRSVRNLTFALNQLDNIIDFVTTLEPLLKNSVPQIIHYLDDLDQRGVFRMLKVTLEVRAKVAEAYTPEDIDQISDGFVALLGLAKKLADPKTMNFIEKLAEIPATVDLETCKDCGPFGLAWASGNREVKQGLGILIELAKAMGRLKSQN